MNDKIGEIRTWPLMQRWSEDHRTVEIKLKLKRLLGAIDEGLTEADVELAIKTVEQDRETAQVAKEAASVFRGEKAAAKRDVEAARAMVMAAERTCNAFRLWLEEIGREAGLDNKPSYNHAKTLEAIAGDRLDAIKLVELYGCVAKIERMLGGGAPLTVPLSVLIGRLQAQLAEAMASRNRAIAASNVDLDKRREVETELATVSHNIQWLNEEYTVLETRTKEVERERDEVTANSGIIVKAYNARLARLALLEEMAKLVLPGHGQRQQSCRLCKIVVELSALNPPTTE